MPREVTIEPNWEGTATFFARALAEHTFEKNAYGPVASFIEQIRYLSHKDPDAVERLIRRLEAQSK